VFSTHEGKYPGEVKGTSALFVYRCTVHFGIYKVHTQTNELFIKLDNVLKFTLKITLTCPYMFRPMTIIREFSLDPSYSYI
jgi:hypothetical protein